MAIHKIIPIVLTAFIALNSLTIQTHAEEENGYFNPLQPGPIELESNQNTHEETLPVKEKPKPPVKNDNPLLNSAALATPGKLVAATVAAGALPVILVGSTLVLAVPTITIVVASSVAGSVSQAGEFNGAVWEKGEAFGITPLQAFALPATTISGAMVGAIQGAIAGGQLIYILYNL